jgi:hypothetical protein
VMQVWSDTGAARSERLFSFPLLFKGNNCTLLWPLFSRLYPINDCTAVQHDVRVQVMRRSGASGGTVGGMIEIYQWAQQSTPGVHSGWPTDPTSRYSPTH